MALLKGLLNLNLKVLGQFLKAVEHAHVAVDVILHVTDDLGSDAAPLKRIINTADPRAVEGTFTNACKSRNCAR